MHLMLRWNWRGDKSPRRGKSKTTLIMIVVLRHIGKHAMKMEDERLRCAWNSSLTKEGAYDLLLLLSYNDPSRT